ncbi:MAG: helix-turn-helix transcriptional regulator [Clostridia bacterium]|nr:helix-turn-helix transcriptional regulator [Clostridia bacterium]
MSNKREGQKILEIGHISAINCFDLSPEFVTTKNSHDVWEFVYVDSGRIFCHTNAKNTELSRGQMIFHRPREVHNTVCNGKSSAAIFTVLFDCTSPAIEYFDGRVITVADELMPLLRLLINESGKAYHVSKYPLALRRSAPMGAQQVVLNYLEAFLLLLMREGYTRESTPIHTDEGEKNKLSEAICDYLREHLHERVTLDMLSERFHFGKVYLCDVFKRSMGCSIMSFHLDLKIAEAKRMLRETGLSVSEISEMLGFESQSYFSRIFKSRVGHPPASFRRMLINNYAVYREK